MPRSLTLVSSWLIMATVFVLGCGSEQPATVSESNSNMRATSHAPPPPPPGSMAPPSAPTNIAENTRSDQAKRETPADSGESGASSDTTKPAGPDSQIGQSLGKQSAGWFASAESNRSGARSRDDDGSVTSSFSWLVQILPFIGHQEIYDQIEFDSSWSNRKNIEQAIQVIPAFQNPLDDRRRWEGYPYQGLALTHFVGVSGVERKRMDVAANYPRSHKDAGIFGYDDVMKPKQVTDGVSNTIAIIGSGTLAGPWMQAGGATVRGARQQNYFDEITGFGSRGLDRKGAAVMTADGAARFVSAEIDPTVFEALCTAHGAESSVDDSALQEPETIPADKQLQFRRTKLAK